MATGFVFFSKKILFLNISESASFEVLERNCKRSLEITKTK